LRLTRKGPTFLHTTFKQLTFRKVSHTEEVRPFRHELDDMQGSAEIGYPIQTGKWVHIAVTYDEEERTTLYVNGKCIYSELSFGYASYMDTTEDLYFGRSAGYQDRTSECRIGEVRICYRVLRPNQFLLKHK